MKLSTLDKNALGSLQKHGELILDEDGVHFRNITNFGFVERKRIERLAELGLARIDKVGQSTFAVPLAP